MGVEWRLLDEGASDASWNMAVDRAIQCAHAKGEAPATLRLYCWDRPSVTLGRFQPLETVDVGVCRAGDIGIARRFTGGRGVLHHHEVTYAVVAGERDGVPRGVSASYRHLCGALADAYRRLGVDAELTSRARGPIGSAACYLHATHADLSVGAAKLSGSAQVWHEGTCLQHGSFVISRDVDLEARIFGLDEQAAHALATSTTTLADLLPEVPAEGAIRQAVVKAMTELFGDTAVEGVLTVHEREHAEELRVETKISTAV